MNTGSVTRREFLAGSVGLMALGSFPLMAEDTKRPNIVFIISDDHRWDVMSHMGHPFMKTPNMDRLAREGVRLSNAFVTTSLCSPSRACFLTSKYVHLHGVKGNRQPFPTDKETTFPQLLQKAGYETAYVGKWHMDGQTAVQQGFDRWVSYKAHGRYIDPVFIIDGKQKPQKGHMTDLTTQYAVDWLKKRKSGKPFLLYMAHKAPHVKCTPLDRHANLYADAKIEPPANSKDTFEGKPAWQKKWPDIATGGAVLQKGMAAYREAVLAYCRTVQGIDDSIGEVLRTLESTGQLENTIVIYCSDNGYYHGDHGLWDKRSAYDESLRIPFLIRFPKMAKPGSVQDKMVLNIDLAPMLLDVAGVKAPSDMQGRSFRPLLEGKKTEWRDDFFYEYFAEKAYPQTPTVLAVRTDDWKYVEYPEIDDIPELYDLKHDPTEMHNLAQDPAHAAKLAEMKQRMARLKKETKYPG